MRANQTRYNLHYHIVFSTKNRVACLKDEDIEKIRELACSKAQEIGSSIRILNGYRDHVHILMSIPPKLSISYVVMRIKGYVSYKMKLIYWQEGFSVDCVEWKNIKRIESYIQNQQTHHRDAA
ncbi:MAG: IS200/IS605 family transposase [Leptospiraceae bacterium]|nr:IS200/IS605 family transposase [Leptospiraceae bacterium]